MRAMVTGAAALALLAGCGGRGDEDWKPIDVAGLSESQRGQYASAEAARDALAGELMATLADELAERGAAGAIAVCKEEAPRIAAATGERLGLRIGRTSWKLRNPRNAAPAWAEPLLAGQPAEPRAAAAPDGRLGVTLPIRIAAPCLACHGPTDELEDDVRAALAAQYPGDRATGFQSGDLRGWFWVEVP